MNKHHLLLCAALISSFFTISAQPIFLLPDSMYSELPASSWTTPLIEQIEACATAPSPRTPICCSALTGLTTYGLTALVTQSMPAYDPHCAIAGVCCFVLYACQVKAAKLGEGLPVRQQSMDAKEA